MGKVLIFYKYIRIEDPEHVMAWQRELCAALGLTGRIIIATEGINATVGGSDDGCQKYIEAMDAHPLFGGIHFKSSPGGADCFPRLSIKVRPEIVALDIDPDRLTPEDGGIHLTPQQAHEMMERGGDDLIILDTRNAYEAEVGTFKGAVVPDTTQFREFPHYIDKNLDTFKDKKVLMACTAGVRCERASAYLKKKGITDVYQITGGIQCYTDAYPDGFFRGKNYVFDGRVTVKVNDDVLGHCSLCGTQSDAYRNCMSAPCNKHYISCDTCHNQYDQMCSEQCKRDVLAGACKRRPPFKKAACSA